MRVQVPGLEKQLPPEPQAIEPNGDSAFDAPANSFDDMAGPAPGTLEALSQAIESSASQDPVSAPESGDLCPKCRNVVRDGAVICVNCGHNFRHGINAATVAKTKKAASGATKLAFLLAGGFGGAFAGGAVWATIFLTIGGGRGLGWITIGVGAIAALGVVLFTKERSHRIGVFASAMAVLGILIGKILIVQWYSPEQDLITTIMASENSMTLAAMMDLAEKGLLDEQETQAVNTLDFDSLSEAQIEKIAERVVAHQENMDEQERKIIAGKFIQVALQNISYIDRIKLTSSFLDFLWFGLAIYGAWWMATHEWAAG